MATINAASCNNTPAQPDVQTAVNTAANGDTVQIPAGSATWTVPVSWTNKQIWVKGMGQGVTNITRNGTAFGITMNAGGTYTWRVSDMTFLTSALNLLFNLSTGASTGFAKGWRIDHITVTLAPGGGHAGQVFMFAGLLWGLVDHATFNGDPFQLATLYGFVNNSAVEDNDCAPRCLGYTYLNHNLNLGSDEAVYFENILLDFADGSGNFADVFDIEYGGSVVLRYSTVNGAFIQTHSTRFGQYGATKYEIYNNTFDGKNFFRWGQIRSGTGVLFNNTVTGYQVNFLDIDGQRESTPCIIGTGALGACNGSNSYDGNTEANGWPCVGAVGRGTAAGFDGTAATQTNTPVYGWKNGSTATCASGGTCDNTVLIRLNSPCAPLLANYLKTPSSPHTNGQFDYQNNGNTPKPLYSALAYPHPLITGGGGGGDVTPPGTPTGLQVS